MENRVNAIMNKLDTVIVSPTKEIGSHKLLIEPEWVAYVFGSLFLVIGIAIWFFYPRAKRSAEVYKKTQLDAYNKKYMKKETRYEKTGMYLPAWQRVKYSAPIFLGIVFIVIGVAFLTMNNLSSL